MRAIGACIYRCMYMGKCTDMCADKRGKCMYGLVSGWGVSKFRKKHVGIRTSEAYVATARIVMAPIVMAYIVMA